MEAHNPKGEMFGFPRLQSLVGKRGKERTLGDTVLEELYSFAGEGWEQEDDITLLTLRRSAAGAESPRIPGTLEREFPRTPYSGNSSCVAPVPYS